MVKKLLLLILTLSIGTAEKNTTTAEIGKPVPDYTFKNIMNSKESAISLGDLKGKVVILEFWATWCGPCLPAMKKLDALQKDFKNEIEIITISTEDTSRLEKFIKSSNTSLRIVSDTAHRSSFKYQIIPHSIIIDKNCIVRAMTSPENITKEVIQELISNDKILLPLKDDFFIDPTLEVKTIKAIANPNYRIELKTFDQEKRGGSRKLKDSDGNFNGIEMWNHTLPRLYQTLFDISSHHRIKYRDGLSEADFPYENHHKYNMTVEASNEYGYKWREIGIDFLKENFDVNARMGIEKVDCYVLRNVDNKIQESTAESTDYMFMGTILKTKKIRMSYLASYLENFMPAPVVDHTNLKGEYDIDMEWQEADLKTLDAELRKYGLTLEKSDRKIPVEIMEIYRK